MRVPVPGKSTGRPDLRSGQFYFGLIERDTGIVLTLNGDRWIGEGDPIRDVYVVTDSQAQAEEHAASVLRTFPKCAAVIYDSKHNCVREFS